MKDTKKTKEQLIDELVHLRRQVAKLPRAKDDPNQREGDILDTEARYRLIADNATDVIWLWDLAANRYVYISPSVKRLRQFTSDEAMAQSLSDTVPPKYHFLLTEELPRRIQAVASGDEKARFQTYEMDQWCKDGSLVATEVVTTLISDTKGQVTHIQGITRDISDRKRAEEALKIAEETYRNIFVNAQIGLFRTDIATGIILDANDTIAHYMGYTDRMDLLSQSVPASYLDPHDRDMITSLLKEKDEVNNIEVPFKKRDGSTVWNRLSAKIIPDKGWIEGVLEDITERKHAENALRESEERYRRIIENMLDIFYRSDLNGRLIMISPSGVALLGYDSENDLIGKDIANTFYYNPEERKKILSILQEKGEVKDFEVTLKHKDGSPIQIAASSRYYRDDQGNILGVEGIFRDIRDRKKAEAKQRKNERQMRAILDACTETIFLMDLEGNVLFANEMTAQRLGMDLKTLLLRKDLFSLIPPDVAKSRKQQVAQVINTGDHVHFEDERQGRTILNSVYPVLEENGQIKQLAVYSMDITDRKEAENALMESEERYRSLFENNHAVMLLIDPDNGVVQDANPAACAYYGWPREEMQGKKINEINTLTTEEIYNEMQLARTQKRNHFFFKHRRADGMIRDVEVFSGPISLEGQSLLYSIVHDISERKRLEEELEIARKLESVGILAGGIAHDFNNLLGTIQGGIELITMDHPAVNKHHKILAMTEGAIRQASELTKRLITFSRGGTPVKKLCNIGEIVKDTIQRSKAGTSVKKNIFIDDDLWWAEVDEGQMRQVITNLAANAIEAMPTGGQLRVRAENVMVTLEDNIPVRVGPYIRISFEDTGDGISEDHLHSIFDPYFSTKGKGSQKGMGLGLSVCYSVVRNHDGCITVESTLGKGSTFHVYLVASVSEKTSENAPQGKEKRKTKGRILLMDDDAMVLHTIAQLLTTQGYYVETAKEGLEAVELYKKAKESGNAFDMVILDLVVKKGFGGMLTMERLLAMDPQVKAIVISGYTDDLVMQNYRQYGFLGAMIKPFNKDELQVILKRYL